jgi:hypothetical protein
MIKSRFQKVDLNGFQTAMLAALPYTKLRDAVMAHLTMAEGFGPLFANVPPRSASARGESALLRYAGGLE